MMGGTILELDRPRCADPPADDTASDETGVGRIERGSASARGCGAMTLLQGLIRVEQESGPLRQGLDNESFAVFEEADHCRAEGAQVSGCRGGRNNSRSLCPSADPPCGCCQMRASITAVAGVARIHRTLRQAPPANHDHRWKSKRMRHRRRVTASEVEICTPSTD